MSSVTSHAEHTIAFAYGRVASEPDPMQSTLTVLMAAVALHKLDLGLLDNPVLQLVTPKEPG